MKLLVSKLKNARGSLLLEMVVAIGFGVTVVVALTGIGVRSLHDSTLSQKRAQITRLSQQGIEAIRSIRDQDIKGAVTDFACLLPINDADPNSPHTGGGGDATWCNEWSDLYKDRIFPAGGPAAYALTEPNASTNYWRLARSIPEVKGDFQRKVEIADFPSPTDPENYKKIKKISVKSWFTDGSNTYESVQETYLRRL